jgi:hypothetical protein
MPRKKRGTPGAWEPPVDRTDPRTGRRKTVRKVLSTLAKAVAFRDEPQVKNEERSRVRFKSFVTQWATTNRERWKPSTRLAYATNLAHAVAALGEFFVDAMKPVDIRSWAADRHLRALPPAHL